MVARSKKIAYFAHLEECLNKYPRAFLVDADFVGSKQISDIRIALRGKVRPSPPRRSLLAAAAAARPLPQAAAQKAHSRSAAVCAGGARLR